jgi:hypothetical protein
VYLGRGGGVGEVRAPELAVDEVKVLREAPSVVHGRDHEPFVGVDLSAASLLKPPEPHAQQNTTRHDTRHTTHTTHDTRIGGQVPQRGATRAVDMGSRGRSGWRGICSPTGAVCGTPPNALQAVQRMRKRERGVCGVVAPALEEVDDVGRVLHRRLAVWCQEHWNLTDSACVRACGACVCVCAVLSVSASMLERNVQCPTYVADARLWDDDCSIDLIGRTTD